MRFIFITKSKLKCVLLADQLEDNCNWQVNVVKGLKLYEDIFNDSELSKLTDFVNELHAAGQNGELSGKQL